MAKGAMKRKGKSIARRIIQGKKNTFVETAGGSKHRVTNLKDNLARKRAGVWQEDLLGTSQADIKRAHAEANRVNSSRGLDDRGYFDKLFSDVGLDQYSTQEGMQRYAQSQKERKLTDMTQRKSSEIVNNLNPAQEGAIATGDADNLDISIGGEDFIVSRSADPVSQNNIDDFIGNVENFNISKKTSDGQMSLRNSLNVDDIESTANNISANQQSDVSNVLNQTAGSGKRMKSGPTISLDNNSALDESLTNIGLDLSLDDIQNSNPSQTTQGVGRGLNKRMLKTSLGIGKEEASTGKTLSSEMLQDSSGMSSKGASGEGFFQGVGGFYGTSFDAATSAIGNQSDMTFSEAGNQIADSFGDLNLGQKAMVGYGGLSTANVGRRLLNNQDGLIRDKHGKVNNAFTPLNPLF